MASFRCSAAAARRTKASPGRSGRSRAQAGPFALRGGGGGCLQNALWAAFGHPRGGFQAAASIRAMRAAHNPFQPLPAGRGPARVALAGPGMGRPRHGRFGVPGMGGMMGGIPWPDSQTCSVRLPGRSSGWGGMGGGPCGGGWCGAVPAAVARSSGAGGPLAAAVGFLPRLAVASRARWLPGWGRFPVVAGGFPGAAPGWRSFSRVA